VSCNLPLAADGWLRDLHATGEQHKEGNLGITGRKQNFSRDNFSQLALGTNAIDLHLRQPRKDLGVSI